MYQSVKQFCQLNSVFTESSIRYHIFNEKTNGLAESGAIVRLGRKVLIKPDKFYEWVDSQNGKGK